MTRIVAFAVAAATASLAGGCQNVGPTAINLGRDRYNSIIQSTSKEQTLSNIIRVYHHEPTSFMEVSEVDATTSFSTNVTGTMSNIGAMATHSTTAGTLSGQVGAVGGSATYSESPLIRYTPLLGQSLVAQLATPVSPDALSSLYNSNWDVMPLLDFSTSYLTPDFNDFYAALNTIAELYSDEVLSVVSSKSELTQKGDSGGGSNKGQPKSPNPPGTLTLEVANKPSGGGADDAITLYLNPFHPRGARDAAARERRDLQLWARLLWLYAGTQPSFTPSNGARCAEFGLSSYSESSLRRLDAELGSGRYASSLTEIRRCMPNSIELRTSPVSASKLRDEHLVTPAPLMRTLSALGILKNATELPHPKISFVTPEQYSRIVDYPWNKGDKSLSFYTLLSETEGPEDDPKKDSKIDERVTRWITEHPDGRFLYEPQSPVAGLDEFMRGNRRLGHLRRYILIIVSAAPIAGAYVAHYDHGLWYYIDAADEVSQKNFDLISLFLTMMAVPSATTPISPTIAVGGAP
jgi:hypothetical protein